MKKFISLAFILISASFIFAQETPQKPLTQAEYVKLLYDLEKNPRKRDEVVEAVRRRGIGFVLTDGLKGLTVTKSRNDAELKRTVEEAGRRRENPIASQLPSEKESAEVLAKAREATLAAVDEMPDFVVKQLISRGYAYAGTNNWKSLDRLAIAVSYSAEKGEQYKVLSVNGSPVNAEQGSNYSGLSGATTSGEFVEGLAAIFKPDRKTEFKLIDTGVVRNRRALVYEYQIALENNKGGGVGFRASRAASGEYVDAGQKGKVWIDRDTFRVLRIEFRLTELPPAFPVKAFESLTEYDWVEISGEKYLLPVMSDARFTTTSSIGLLQDRNLIRFKDYQKYGTEVKILDEEEVPEEKPNQ
jgi:hypothetical protein